MEQEIEMEQPLTLIQRRNFMQLPLEERRRLMAQQADKLSEHYDQDQEWRDVVGWLLEASEGPNGHTPNGED